jgi:hypothetical protein
VVEPGQSETNYRRAAVAHGLTWLVVFAILGVVWWLHVRAAGHDAWGESLRAWLREGKPRGSAREGANYGLARAIPVFLTALVLAHRYVDGILWGGVVFIGTGCVYAFQYNVLGGMILATDPTFPADLGARSLGFYLFIALPGCLFGAGLRPENRQSVY